MSSPTSLPIGSTIILALTATSAQSAAVAPARPGESGAREVVRLCSTADVWLTVGASPTAIAANAASFLLPAGVVEYIDVPSGYKIAGILASGTGTLSIATAGAK